MEAAQQEPTAAPTAASLQEPAAKQVQAPMGSAAKAAKLVPAPMGSAAKAAKLLHAPMGSAAKLLPLEGHLGSQHCHCLPASPRVPSWPCQPPCGPPSP